MASALPLVILSASSALLASAVPQGFPASGNGLWYTSPGQAWATHWLPVGNGYLAAMTAGGTTQETTQLNIESLWSGGPFQDTTYNGGNKQPSERAQMAMDMRRIRQTIFLNGTIDNVEELASPAGAYGSYAGSGYLITTLNSSSEVDLDDYGRWLDLEDGIARVTWSSVKDNRTVSRTTLCSHPTRACTQHLIAGRAPRSTLPSVTHAFSSGFESGLPQANVSCLDSSTLRVVGNVGNPGMAYELLFRAVARGEGSRIECSVNGGNNATLLVEGASEEWITWVGDTEYDMEAGSKSSNYSFARPLSAVHASLTQLLDSATDEGKAFKDILSAHTSAYKANRGDLTLSFGANANLNVSTLPPTDELVADYKTDEGNTYLEWLIFNFGRHLLACSAPGTLPSNLQGKWAMDTSPPWSADYHSNINIQMNYWFTEITGAPSHVITPLFDYIQKTWAPRGSETALTLYNISRGFVTHNEMNIFGHTGMKLDGNSAQWADYPESAAWMMLHVWDHFDFTGDTDWWRAQGWPLLKGVAAFHSDKLISDNYFNDTTLVVAPCNSPEQAPITFGCAHAQQLIWQLFNAVEKGWEASGDSDAAFLEEIRTKRAMMDKGIHVGSWGQLQEWKLDMDSPNDTHRHLSHLIGAYPGYALTSYNATLQSLPAASQNSTYTRSRVLDAAKTSLIRRGNGTGPDGDAGWEKVWRAAMWAQFGDAEKFYHQLTYSIERNFGPNLFSLYNPLDPSPFFQIDANFGYPAAVLNGLIHNPDVASKDTPYTITLLPALPQAWSSGTLKHVHLRGGLKLDMEWDDRRPKSLVLHSGSASRGIRIILAFNESAKEIVVEVGSTHRVVF